MKRFSSLGLAMVCVLTLGSLVKAVTLQTIDTTAKLSASKTSLTITGTTICTAGFDGSIFVDVFQNSGKVNVIGLGAAEFTCTGTLQTYSVVVDVAAVGSAFKKGPAIAASSVTETDPNDPSNTDTGDLVQEGIHISQ